MNQYALLAGISRYKDDQISDLQFAAKDVLAFRDRLIGVLGFDEENVHVFTDEPGKSFAVNNAVIGCFSRICRKLESGDTFIFYFAGHGVEKPDGVYLMTANTESYSESLIKMTSIPVRVLQDELVKTPAANRVFIIDACRNDPEKGRGDSDNLLTPTMSRDLIYAAEIRSSAIIQPPCTGILFACTTNERAYEWPEKSHGVFSYYLLEAVDHLGGEHGEVDLAVLERRVKANVINWCRDNLPRDKTQQPWLHAFGGVPIIGKKRGCGSFQPRPSIVSEIFIEEEALSGAVSLTCSEPGATISIGEASFASKTGVRQVVRNLPAGIADVVAEKEGFDSFRSQVTIEPDQTVFLRIEMVAQQDSVLITPDETASLLINLQNTENSKSPSREESHEVEVDRLNSEILKDENECLHSLSEKGEYRFYLDNVHADRFALWKQGAQLGLAGGQWLLGLCCQYGIGVDEDSTEAVKWYRMAAEQGDARAQSNLGVSYQYGEGVDEDSTEAVKWYRMAAEQGYARAQSNLGFCYDQGIGVDADPPEAVKWYRMAAEQGDARAQFNLGFCYQYGEGVDADSTEAVNWYRKAAEQGDVDAQVNLGFCYDQGIGVDADPPEAVKWYRMAAEQGDARAQSNLGGSYQYGEGVDEDSTEAVKWYRLAAEQGNAQAQFNLGVSYRVGIGVDEDSTEAVKWYRMAAEQGYARAQFSLGVSYQYGEGVDEDPTEAVKWYRMAAEQGDADAQYKLGSLYDQGIKVNEDPIEAVRWYRMAAEQGDARAQVNLGLCYDNGEGVDVDPIEAVKWYRKAAEQGDSEAQYYLGYGYEIGEGVDEDPTEAVKWYRMAAEQGDADAQYKLGSLYDQGIGVDKDPIEAVRWYRMAAGQGHSEAQYKLGSFNDQGIRVDEDSIEAFKLIPPAPAGRMTNSIGMEFVYIEPGTFMMGSPKDEPGRSDDEELHQVTLTQGYYLQTTPVTQGQWKAVMGGDNNPSNFKGDDLPVETVSWDDAQVFIRALNQQEGTAGYVLPTEAQWEYAARAGSTTAFANGQITETGDGYDPVLESMGWYRYNSGGRTHPVAQKDPNAWGLYDMHGNVYEWVADWYDDYPSSAENPTGPQNGAIRVLRGGSWYYNARSCRSAGRRWYGPGYRYINRGFRLARHPGQQ